jgi:hypothetical protein
MAAYALGVADGFFARNFNIHRADFVALFAAYATARAASDFENADFVEESKQCAVGAKVLAPGSFNKERKNCHYPEHYVGCDCDFI